MSTYICHNCEIKFRLKRLENDAPGFAEKCPVCLEDEQLEYL